MHSSFGPQTPRREFEQANTTGRGLEDALRELGLDIQDDTIFPDIAIKVAEEADPGNALQYSMMARFIGYKGEDSPRDDTRILIALWEVLAGRRSPWSEYSDEISDVHTLEGYPTFPDVGTIWVPVVRPLFTESRHRDPLAIQPEEGGWPIPLVRATEEYRMALIRESDGTTVVQFTRLVREIDTAYGRSFAHDICFIISPKGKGQAIRVDRTPRGRIEDVPGAKVVEFKPLLVYTRAEILRMDELYADNIQRVLMDNHIEPQICIMDDKGEDLLDLGEPKDLSRLVRKYRRKERRQA